MADVMRLVTIDEVGRARQVLELNRAGEFMRVRDSFRVALAPARARTAAGPSRYAGSRAVSTMQENTTVSATFTAAPGTAAGAVAMLEGLLGQADRVAAREPLYVEWRPEGLARSVYWEVRGPATVTPSYNPQQFAGAKAIGAEVSWTVAPLAIGLPMDLAEDFRPPPRAAAGAAPASGDDPLGDWTGLPGASPVALLVESKLADYTVDAGAPVIRWGTDPAERGLYAPGQVRLRHTGRGYPLTDAAWAATIRPPYGAAYAGSFGAGRATIGDLNRRLYARVDESGAARSLNLVGETTGIGSAVTLASAAIAALAADTAYAVRLVTNGTSARAELWPASPRRAGKPTTVTAWFDASTYITGPGQGFWHYDPNSANSRLVELLEEPFTFADVASPGELPLKSVPGNAPALAEVRVSKGATTADYPFGLLAWRRRRAGADPSAVNADGTAAQWQAGADSLLNAGGAIAAAAAGGPGGAPLYTVTAAAGALTGGDVTLWRRFKRGRTYTLEFYANIVAGAFDVASVFDPALTGLTAVAGPGQALAGAGWQRYRLTFTTSADHVKYLLGFRNGAGGGAGTLRVSRIRLWEGGDADAPASRRSDGAFPAFGYIAAAATVGAAPTVVDDAAAPNRRAVSIPASTTFTGVYPVDSSTVPLPNDERGTRDVELYMIGSTVAIGNLTAKADVDGTYAREWGATGKIIPTLGGAARGAWRLGTLTLDADAIRRARLTLTIALTRGATAGNCFIYGFILVPAGQRLTAPTGKAQTTSYPVALKLTSGTYEGKRFDAAGRGYQIDAVDGAQRPDASLAGAPVELEPGDNELLTWLSTAIPDDPTNNSYATAGGPLTLDTVHVAITPRYRLLNPA